MVTLRGERMYEFFDRLVNVALPRVRDFKGVSDRSFDGRGNYSLGIREQIIFPEIDLDKIDKVKGLTIVDLHDGADRRARARRCCGRSACRSAAEESTVAKTCLTSEGDAAAEVQGAAVQPLPAVRAAAGVLPPLPDVPALPARSRAQGADSRPDQGELVTRMSMTDPIADLLTRIRNGTSARKERVDVPWSRLKEAIARVLVARGLPARAHASSSEGARKHAAPRAALRRAAPAGDHWASSASAGRACASTSAAKRFRSSARGLGISILSTPAGILVDREARSESVGGELLCAVW